MANSCRERKTALGAGQQGRPILHSSLAALAIWQGATMSRPEGELADKCGVQWSPTRWGRTDRLEQHKVGLHG